MFVFMNVVAHKIELSVVVLVIVVGISYLLLQQYQKPSPLIGLNRCVLSTMVQRFKSYHLSQMFAVILIGVATLCCVWLPQYQWYGLALTGGGLYFGMRTTVRQSRLCRQIYG